MTLEYFSTYNMSQEASITELVFIYKITISHFLIRRIMLPEYDILKL